MTLEEFQKVLRSDAVVRCKELEKEIEKKDEFISDQNGMLKNLFNRCYTLTAPEMCWFCDMKESCSKLRSINNSKSEKAWSVVNVT